MTFLSEPWASFPRLWKYFREETAKQLSLCRQCTSAYHKAVNEWELSNEVLGWSKEVIRKRVSNLVKWDALRLTPVLERGSRAALSCNDSNLVATRTQCREALLDATLSLRLCMDTAFCAVLSEVFRAGYAVPTCEEFTKLIRAHGAIPPGLAALCFHRSSEVRLWATSLYLASPPLLEVDKQALQALMSKSLRLASERSTTVDKIDHSRHTAWAPNSESLWSGLNVLIKRMPSDPLRVMMKRCKKFPIVDAVYNFLALNVRSMSMNGVLPGFSDALSSFQLVLVVAPLQSLFGCCSCTLQEFLDVILECCKLRSLRQSERMLLLDVIMDIYSSSITCNDIPDRRGLLSHCFHLLEYLRSTEGIDTSRARQNKTARNRENDSCADILTKFAQLFLRLYWHFWLQLRMEDGKRLTEFITSVVRALPDKTCAWELLRSALLTDVCGLLLCIYEPPEVQNIFNKFFSLSTEIGEENKRTTLLQEGITKLLTDERGTPLGYLGWMDELWSNVTTGAHISEESRHLENVCLFDMRLALDLHRLVGVLDPQRCGDIMKQITPDSSRVSVVASDRLVSQRVKAIFDTILARIQHTSHFSTTDVSLQDLPRQAWHLLSSSHKKISSDVHRALLKKCKIQNATVALPQSRDKVMVHILKHDEKDCLMVYEGFMSTSKMISAHSRAVSARTYTSFFRWYSLLASRDYRILWDSNIFTEAFKILLNFLNTLDDFEAGTTSEAFPEVVCRIFSTIPFIWDSFNDFERSTQDGTTERSRCVTRNVRLIVRKVAAKLLTSYSTKDKLVLDAWVRMVTGDAIRSALNGMEDSRDILMRMLRKNIGARGPLNFSQCRRLADAYSLDKAGLLLDEWSTNEADRQRHQPAIMKVHRDERITGFSSMRSRDSTTAHPTTRQRPLLAASTSSARRNGHLRDLRRDHRQARADLRRATGGYGPTLAKYEPLKTRFELIREERIARKRREKLETQHDMSTVHRLDSHSEDSDIHDYATDTQNDSCEPGSQLPNQLEEIEPPSVCYPRSHRTLPTRAIEQVKRAVLISEDPHCLGTELYTGTAPQTFQNVESYVTYWEPLLIAEFRAAIRRSTDEQRFPGAQNSMGTRNLDPGRIFEVDGPAEDIGYLHTLSISSCNKRKESRLDESVNRGTRPFEVSKEQTSDVLLLEISGRKHLHPDEPNDGHDMIPAIVSNVVRTKKKIQLSLLLVFSKVVTPGKGRKVRVRKLLSFTTLHRQLNALWALPKAQDGILWSLMDPATAWRTKRDLEAREDHRFDHNSLSPMRIVEKVERLGILNASQCKAIADVIRSCYCLFASPNRRNESRYQNENSSGVSLIQGPPGTGKTSTIIALLSALLSGIGSQQYVHRTKVVDGISVTTTIPAIRILVCAPSNAAVDEIMTRVVNEGLITLSEYQVCPRIVRVGHGTTISALQALEVHSIAKSLRRGTPLPESARIPHFSKDHQELLEVKEQIEKLEVGRRSISMQRDAKSDMEDHFARTSPSASATLKTINEKLQILQDKRNQLHSILQNKRETRKTEDTSSRQEDMRAVFESLSTASIVFATLNSAGHEDLKSLGAGFDVVIIDEAGQSCEPEALIPMSVGQGKGSMERRFMHTVLVGDPKQLPPTVLSANHQVATALGRSLFERIACVDPSAVHLLDTQYRMHPKLSSFPSSRFYDGLLRNSTRVRDKSMHRIWHFDEKKRFGPLTLFDMSNTFGKEARTRNGSLSNEVEAKFVIQAILSMLRLYQRENLVENIVALSPYKQQVQLLKRLISQNEELRDANVEASTVDGIQGREKSVVVLSTVRSGHSRDIGFVKDERRLNVALTRAKHSLLIFGHAEFLSKNSASWAALVSHCHERSQSIPLAGVHNAIFRESHGGVRSWIPKVLPEIDKLPDINDEIAAGVLLAPNITTETESFCFEKGSEKIDVLEQTAVNSTGATRKPCNPHSQATEIHCDRLQRHSVHDKPIAFNSAMEQDDERRPQRVKSEEAFTTSQSHGSGFGSAEKRQKLSKGSHITTLEAKRHVAKKVGTNLSIESQIGHSNLIELKRRRSLARDKEANAAPPPSLYHKLQQGGSSQTGERIHVSRRLPGKTAGAGGSPASLYHRLQQGGSSQLSERTQLSRRLPGKAAGAGAPPPSLYHKLQQGGSSQLGGRIHLSRRLPGKAAVAGGTNADREKSKALLPAKRAYSSLNHAPLYNSATKLKKARTGTTFQRSSTKPTHSLKRSLHEQRMMPSFHAKRRGFQTSLHFQNQRQGNQRLLHHRNANREQKDRTDRLPNPNDNRCVPVQAQRRNAMSTFSLADTSAKLKLTLEAARKAKQ